jgi:serine/threonine protein kinase
MTATSPRSLVSTPSALPEGTRLGEFELRGLLGVGGFGIVYLAFDHSLEREVAIKEYMPAALAERTQTQQVSWRTQSDAETFTLGKNSFLVEARLLAHFDHPSLLKVHRYWEANGTAYMAMPVMRGRTLKEIRRAMSAPPDEAWLRSLLDPLLGAIQRLHAKGVYHRDIAPDNILIEPEGHPVLLDFGAARRVINDVTQTLTAILKPAYAPIEQYAEVGAVRQGPWTDLYSLGATLHYLMLARPPAPATARAVHDEASALTRQALPGCSENFLRTVDWMLAPRPVDRPQSVADLREVLDGRALPPVFAPPPPPPEQSHPWDSTVVLGPHDVADRRPMQNPPPRVPLSPPVSPPVLPLASALSLTPAAHGPDPATDVDLPFSRDVPPTIVADPAGRTGLRPVVRPVPRSAERARTDPVLAFASSALPGSEWDLAAIAASPGSGARSGSLSGKRSRRLFSGLPIAVGLGSLALALATYLWLRPVPPVDASGDHPAADLLPGMGLAAEPASPMASGMVGTVARRGLSHRESVPESHVARLVLPVRRPRPTPTEAPELSAEAGKDTGTGLASGDAGAANPAAPAGERQAGAGPTAQPTAAAPSADRAPAAVPTLANVAATADAASGPEATCAGGNGFQHFFCMERECLRSALASHPECLKWHHQSRSPGG